MTDMLAARFGFARLVVRDLQGQAAFYRAVMGYGDGMTIRDAIGGRAIEEIIFMENGKAELILLAYDDGDAPASGGAMLGFTTDDLPAFEARVVAAGGTIYQPIGRMEAGGKVAQFAIYGDPEGFLLELIQW